MRHLKALVVALSIFVAAIAFYQRILHQIEGVQVACAGIFALLGYRWGLRAGLPTITFFPLLYIGGLYAQAWQSVIGTNVEGRTNLFFAGLALVYLHHPVLVILRKLHGQKLAWQHHGWSSVLSVLLLTFWPWVAFNYLPGVRQYKLVLVVFALLTLPMALIGFLARHESRTAAAASNAQSAAFRSRIRRLRALWSRRGRPLFVRMLQGWIVSLLGIFLVMLATVFITKQLDDLLMFVALCIVLAPPCARLGRKMRLGILCLLLLLACLYLHAGYFFGFGRISDLATREFLQAAGWTNTAWNILNLVCGLMAELALLCGFLAVLAYGVRARSMPWLVLKWSFTIAAACLTVIVVTQSIFMLSNFTLSFWLQGSWTMTVTQGLIVLPPVLMALALWLNESHPAMANRIKGP